MVDQVKLNDGDNDLSLNEGIILVSRRCTLSSLLLSNKKCGSQIFFAHSIIGLTIALCSFRNPSLFKSVKALFMHAKTRLVFEATSEVC